MSSTTVPEAAVLVPARTTPAPSRSLTAPESHQLAQVRRSMDWFANIGNANSRRASRNDLGEFMGFVGIASPDGLRLVTRAHLSKT